MNAYFWKMDEELNRKWQEVVKMIEARFDADIDFAGILFLIGIQELGHGFQKLNKDQKLDVMHIAVCRLLSEYGYYEFMGRDEAGWPHWKRNKKLPALKPADQDMLIRQAIVEYFI